MTKERAPRWQRVYKDNRKTIGSNPNLIKPGQRLKMPDGSTHVVKKGENLTRIAAGAGKPMPKMTKKPAPPAEGRQRLQPIGSIGNIVPPPPGPRPTPRPLPPTRVPPGDQVFPVKPPSRVSPNPSPIIGRRPNPVQEDITKPGFGRPSGSLPVRRLPAEPMQPGRMYPMRQAKQAKPKG